LNQLSERFTENKDQKVLTVMMLTFLHGGDAGAENEPRGRPMDREPVSGHLPGKLSVAVKRKARALFSVRDVLAKCQTALVYCSKLWIFPKDNAQFNYYSFPPFVPSLSPPSSLIHPSSS
jgi:hypothetical protein